MSIRQLCIQLDPVLKETFERDDLDSKQWFATLDKLVAENKPKEYQYMKSYDIVLAYVRYKSEGHT